MTMLPTDCEFAWGWNRGQQSNMSTVRATCQHHIVTHVLDSVSPPATQSTRKVLLESKMWRDLGEARSDAKRQLMVLVALMFSTLSARKRENQELGKVTHRSKVRPS